MVSNIHSGTRYSVIRFHDKRCYRSQKFGEYLSRRTDLNIDVHEIDVEAHREIAHLYGVTYFPTAILLDDGIPVSRMEGLCETENFLDFVADIVILGHNSLG
jgi:thioredoxin-like negative regulator of GroEL